MNVLILTVRCIFFTAASCLLIAGGYAEDQERLTLPLIKSEGQRFLKILADGQHPQIGVTSLTNRLTNTNLFSPQEQEFLKNFVLTYKNASTNALPIGSVFNGWKSVAVTNDGLGVKLKAACFGFTNRAEKVEVVSFSPDIKYSMVKQRDAAGDGYNACFMSGNLVQFHSFRGGKLDGLSFQGAGDGDPERCSSWLRFEKGKAVGQFLAWDDEGDIVARAEFKEPFDWLKYQVANTIIDWP